MKSNLRKLIGAFTATAMCITMLPQLPAATTKAAKVGDKLTVQGGQTQFKGDCDGYSYEVWLDNTGGSGSMTLGPGATFKAEWSASVNRGNFLARRGLAFDSSKKATAYDYIGMDYEADYRQTGSASGNSRLCVYGWFQNRNAGNVPLVEYYIIEDWVDWCPDGNGKMVTIDGAQYKIFQNDHTGPSINSGNETFKQYFSVRQDKRKSGHITVSDHFKAWESQGWGIGNLYEVALNAEGWQSSGVADVTMLDVYLDPDKAGQGGTVTPAVPVEPDENGYYFHSTFEDGTDSWSGRGAASVKSDSTASTGGSKSLAVTGRTDSWNGAAIELNNKAFKAGESYGFSVNAMQNTSSSEEFKLTLECSINGEKQYLNVAKATAGSGEWVTLANPSFEIPSGATGCLLYVETSDSTTSFYIDDAIGAVEGKIPASTVTPPTPTKYTLGDINDDGIINVFDVVACRTLIVNAFAAGASKNPAADVNSDGTVDSADLVLISEYVLCKIKKFPEPVITTTTTTTTVTTTTTKAPVSNSNIMEQCRNNFNTNVPGNISGYRDSGKSIDVKYQSSVTGTTKPAVVWVPKGYDSSKKYNVLYMNHGVFGNETSMLGGEWGVREMASYFIDNGLVDPFIVVFTQMYSGPGGGTPSFMDMNMNTMDNYDKFLQDMTDCLMPYIEKNYSVYTGKEHTAIAGFSMGGRESLYLTISRPDLFGYCCASSPAPGIVPASDNFIANHLGSKKADGSRMTNSDFKIAKDQMPYLIMIGGGTNDTVVGTFPESYHNLFTQNGTDHVWQSFPGKGHDQGVGLPMFYNFFQYLFKV